MVYLLTNNLRVAGKRVVSLEPVRENNIDRIEVEDPVPDGGLYFGHGRALISGRRIKTDYVPKGMRVDVGSAVPDYGSSHCLKFVSDRFKAIVEDIEPGVHQFIPFQIVGPGKVVLADMWFMVVCNRLDGMDRERTTLVLVDDQIWLPAREAPREQWPSNVNPNVKGKFVFSLAKIGDHHLWYDKHSIYGPYLSDRLAQALMDAGVTGADFIKQESV